MFQSLSGSIAHEVRNPISAAKQSLIDLENGVETLQQAVNNNDQPLIENRINMLKRRTHSAYEVLNRGDVVIRMILKNIHDKKIDPTEFKDHAISPIIHKALNEYPLQEHETGLIEYKLGDDFIFRGDENLLIFILFNLIKNALYYLPEDGGKITLTAHRGEKQNYLVFLDNGSGIKPEQLPHIFDNFASYNTVSGTGLGLPFCKRAISAMGGDIACRSQEGEGAEFILSFPHMNQ